MDPSTGLLLSEEREEFLNEVNAELKDAAVVKVYDAADPDGSLTHTMNGWIWRWLSTRIARSSDWETSARFVNVLRDGVRTGSISFGVAEDLDTFRSFLFSCSEGFPELIGHYVSTGEFMGLASLMEKKFRTLPVNRGRERATWTIVHSAMLRLYAFDQNADTGSLQLPLEMRAHLSGFYDDEERDMIA